MRDIDTKQNKKNEKFISHRAEQKNRNASPYLMFPVLLCGVFGLVLFFDALPGVDFEKILILGEAAAFCGIFTFLLGKGRKVFYISGLVTLGLTVIFALALRNLLGAELSYLLSALTGSPVPEPPSVTLPILGIVPMLTAVILFFLNRGWGRVLMGILSVALIFSAPIVRASESALALLALLIFAVLLPFLKTSERRGGGKAAVLTLGIVLILAGLTALFVYPNEERLSDITYSAEGSIFRFIAKKTDRNTDTVQGGKISPFNNYLTDREQLIVQITRPPKDTIYLKGFVGGEYKKGEWEAADDTAILGDIQDKYQNSWGIMGISNTYSSLFFTMNMNTLDDSIPSPGSMAVRYISSEGKNYYVPYYSRVETIYVYGGYRFQYFEKADMKINWNNVAPVYERKRDQCLNLRTAYYNEAKNIYTKVPEDKLPRLREMCAYHDFETLSEITDFIKTTLEEKTEYTLTPGWTTPGGDPVEEFLFDRGRGYCVHYAAAATLMYRMFGVPARYVTGYMIEPSDFERQRYGTYNAVLKDENAHAWVEIFLQNYGWTPVEMTPHGDGEIEPEIYAAGSEEERTEQEAGLNLNINLIPKTRDENEEDSREEAEISEEEETEEEMTDYSAFETAEEPIKIGAAVILILALAAALFMFLRRKIRRSRHPDCRREFLRLLEALSASGKLSGYDGTEADFCDRLGEILENTDRDALNEAINTVSEAAYGPQKPSPQAEAFAIKTLRTARKEIRQSLPLRKKAENTLKDLLN